MEPVRLGVVGCGLAATNLHWPTLKLLQREFRIVAVSDPVRERAKEFARLVGGVPYEPEHNALLANYNLEAVIIAAPIPLHYPLAADALKAGKHVFVEKPLAADLEQGQLMLELEQRHPQVKIVGENFRYRKALRRTREIMESGKIGRAYAGFSDFLVDIDTPDNPYVRTPWRVKPEFPGGAVLDTGIHWAAQVRCLFGDIDVKEGQTASINANLGQVDSLSFQFQNAQGLSGVANLFLSAKEIYEDRVTILGTEGTLTVTPLGTGFGNVKITIRRRAETSEESIENDTGIVEEFRDFYDAIRRKGKVRSSFGEAYKDLKVVLDALGSK